MSSIFKNSMNKWNVYLIYNQTYTYIGATPNLKQRIRKHNGEIKGGAKYTTRKGSGWKYIGFVSGFKNKIDALQFEWAWKHIKPRGHGIKGRLSQLEKLLKKEKWTSNSVLSYQYPLQVNIIKPEYIEEEFVAPSYVELNIHEEIL